MGDLPVQGPPFVLLHSIYIVHSDPDDRMKTRPTSLRRGERRSLAEAPLSRQAEVTTNGGGTVVEINGWIQTPLRRLTSGSQLSTAQFL